jgi:hypothetical protein
VLASDAAHYDANIETGNHFPIFYDLGEMAEGWRSATRLAGDPQRVVPGHDPKVREIYPAVAGSNGEIVALHRRSKV